MSRTHLSILAFLLILLPTTLPAAASTTHQTTDNRLFDRIITLLLKIGHYPSLSACIVQNGSIAWENQYGYYDLMQKKPATADTIYIVASITKTIVSTALMQLYDQGLFALDDDVNEYLPFRLCNPNFPDQPITVRMLLSHTSSLSPDPPSYHWFNFSHTPPVPWYPDPWLREYLLPNGTFYQSDIWDAIHQPGEYMQYANINYDLVGYLVQLLSGEPLYQYCAEHIFQPLFMNHTTFLLPSLPLDDVAVPYTYQKGTYDPLPYYQLLHYPVAGVYTTVEDLSHFLIAHMNQGVYHGVRILRNETTELMHTVQPPGNIYYNYRYGLGWMIEDKKLPSETLIGHTGDIPGVHTRMFMQEHQDAGVICFYNSDRDSAVKMFVSLLIQRLLFSKADRLR